MKKVVFIVPYLAPYAKSRFEYLAQNEEIELHIIIEKDKTAERIGWQFEKINGCQTYLLNSKVTERNIKNKSGNYSTRQGKLYSFGLKNVIGEIKPDIVVVCNSTQIFFIGSKRNFKLGVIVEDTLRADESRNLIRKFLKKIFLKKSDFYIPFSDDAIKFLSYQGIKSNLIKSSWSVDLSFFQDIKEERYKYKKKMGLSNKRNYLIVANLIERKGIMQFLEIWKAMSMQFHENCELYIIGEGILRRKIEMFISDMKIINVHILGNKPYREVSHYMQCVDAFILPTLEDLCSLVMFEALASGLPLLTSIYNGARFLIKDEVNGYVFDPLNKESAIEILNKLDKADLTKMANESKKSVKNYTHEVVMNKLADNLLSILYNSELRN